jgi:lipoprotein-anchoring transpeptidase ErfK/SrfK
MGQHMAQNFAATRRSSPRAIRALVLAGALLMMPAVLAGLAGAASAQTLGYAPMQPGAVSQNTFRQAAFPQAALPQGYVTRAPAPSDEQSVVPERLRRAVVNLDTREAAGTIIIDTGNTVLYYVLGHGRAIRFGVGVGREGFTWSGVQTISRKAEWPDWYPPAEMIARQPYLPRFVAGGPGNPLGARAIYLGSSEYRIHGTNDPSTIGKFVSSGCIRMTNEDVTDLVSRVDIGTKVVVLPKNSPLQARGTITVRPTAAQARPVATMLPSGGQAMNISTSSVD